MGVEVAAINAKSTREKAGDGGSKSSQKAKERRIVALLEAMELTVEQNPAVTKLGIDSVLELALHKAVELDSRLWGQGRGQIKEYNDRIRRGEAGDELRDRWQRLFPPKPLKRF
jgi:hypothetical protein